MKHSWLGGAFLLLLIALPASLFAQDALYDPDPPAGSAFVRVVNGTGAATAATLGDRDFGEVAAQGSTKYRVVPQGSRAWKANGAAFDVAEGGFYTVLIRADGSASLLVDPVLSSRSKALVIFYNADGEGSWDLKTADGKVPLITGVATGGNGSREVNGIKVDLAAFSGQTASPSVPGIQLERGNAYSFFLFKTAAGLQAVWAQNTTTTR
jgi:alginate O-acetyltransferase complex protein AlgF